MATIDELIASIEVERDAAQMRLNKAIAEGKAIIALANSEGRANTSEEEDLRLVELTENRSKAKADLKGIQKKLEDAQRIKLEEAEAVREAKEVTPTPAATRVPKKYDEFARVGAEERTYNPGWDRKGSMFLRDVCRQFLYNDVQSAERLSRHMHEERVERAQQITRAAGDTTTSNWSGLVVPQYLTDMYAPATAAMRPLADICNPHDLPADGLTVNISQVTTPSTVGLQATELGAPTPTAQSLDDSLLTENVQTATGEQTLSRQAIDRGTGIEEVVMNDLFRRYATRLDTTLINQATTGLSAVAQNNDTTATDPTAAGGLYLKLHQGLSQLEANFLGFAAPSHAVMHSRRWYSLSSKLTSTWPLVNQPGSPPSVIGVNFGVDYNKGIRGILPNGLKVVVDNNVTTTGGGTAGTQDEVYVVAADELHLWEDPAAPVFIRAEQPKANTLGVLLVLYGYFAYSFRRYANGQQKLTGAGLVAPTF